MNACRAINNCLLNILQFGNGFVRSDGSQLSVMKFLDKTCGIIAIVKTAWIVLFFFIVQLPFEYGRNDFFPYTFLRLLCGLWLTYSVSYHFWKARTAKPIRLPRKTTDGPNCSFCSASKPHLTSHCRTCNTCIYRRDHHCPWMGQCVGIHNQANFFLFLFNVFLSTVLVLYVEYAFWMENWKVWMEGHRSEVLSEGTGAAAAFSIAITVTLHLIMISFVVAYSFLVSGGFSLVDTVVRIKRGISFEEVSVPDAKRGSEEDDIVKNLSSLEAIFGDSSERFHH